MLKGDLGSLLDDITFQIIRVVTYLALLGCIGLYRGITRYDEDVSTANLGRV